MSNEPERPSLRCARTMHTVGIAVTQSEELLAQFIDEKTGCDGLLDAAWEAKKAMSTLICEHDDFRVMTEGAWANLRTAHDELYTALPEAKDKRFPTPKCRGPE